MISSQDDVFLSTNIFLNNAFDHNEDVISMHPVMIQTENTISKIIIILESIHFFV